MANEYYITAGLPPNDTDQANTANTYYISAGLIDEDVASGAARRVITVTEYKKWNPYLLIGSAIAVVIARNPKLSRRDFFKLWEWLE